MSDSLWLQGLKPPSLLCIQSPDKNTGVGWHALLQGIYQTQGLNLHLLWLLHCRWILYCWAINGSPEDVVGSLQVSVAQLFPTLCDPMDYSPPGFSVHEILQARILEWVAILFSRGSSQHRVWTWVSRTAGRFSTIWATGAVCKVAVCNEPYLLEIICLCNSFSLKCGLVSDLLLMTEHNKSDGVSLQRLGFRNTVISILLLFFHSLLCSMSGKLAAMWWAML